MYRIEQTFVEIMHLKVLTLLLICLFLPRVFFLDCLQEYTSDEADSRSYHRKTELKIVSLNTTANLFLSNVFKILLEEALAFKHVNICVRESLSRQQLDESPGKEIILQLWKSIQESVSSQGLPKNMTYVGPLGVVKKYQLYISKNTFTRGWKSSGGIVVEGWSAFKHKNTASMFSSLHFLRQQLGNSRHCRQKDKLPLKTTHLLSLSLPNTTLSDLPIPPNGTQLEYGENGRGSDDVTNITDSLHNFVSDEESTAADDDDDDNDDGDGSVTEEEEGVKSGLKNGGGKENGWRKEDGWRKGKRKCCKGLHQRNKLCTSHNSSQDTPHCGVLLLLQQDELLITSLQLLIETLQLRLEIYCLERNSEFIIKRLINENFSVLIVDWSLNGVTSGAVYKDFVSFDLNGGFSGGGEMEQVHQMHQAHKLIHKGIQTHYPSVNTLLSNFHFNHHLLAPVVLNASSSHSGMKRLACDWLRENRKRWKGWLQSGNYNGTSPQLASIICGTPTSILPYPCSTLVVITTNTFITIFFLFITIACILAVRNCYRRKLERLCRELGLHSNKSSCSNHSNNHSGSHSNSHSDCHHFLKLYNSSQDSHSISTSTNNSLDQWELSRGDVVMNRKLGEGAFGTVFGGESLIGGKWVAVAVKTLKLHFRPEEKLNFLSEAEIMKNFQHDNIVKLLGVCKKGEPVLTVMEFMLHGDLKTFLLSRRQLVGQVTTESEDVSSKQLTRMSLDVLYGLKYLSSLNFVHRDIACRNCLVHSNKTVKIGDFGMARQMDESDHYKFNKRGMFPVRWMAPESLMDGLFSTPSDVWSFGVLIYEVFTFGAFPYQGFSNSQVLNFVKGGGTLSLPSNCPFELEALLKRCWSFEASERIRVDELIESFVLMPSLIVPCLESPNALVTEEEFLAPHDHCSPEVSFPARHKSTSKTRNVNSFLGLNLIPRLRHRNQYQRNLLFVNRSSTPVNALCQNKKAGASAFNSGGTSAGHSFHSDESDMKLLRSDEATSHESLYNTEALFAGKQSRTISTGLSLLNRRNKNSVLSLPSFHTKSHSDKLSSKVVLAVCEATETAATNTAAVAVAAAGGDDDSSRERVEKGDFKRNKQSEVKRSDSARRGEVVRNGVLEKALGSSKLLEAVTGAYGHLVTPASPECLCAHDHAEACQVATLKRSDQREKRDRRERRVRNGGQHSEGNEDLSNHDDELFGSRSTVIHCDMHESLVASKNQLANLFQPVSLSCHLHRSISHEDLAFSGKTSGDYYSAKRSLVKSIFQKDMERKRNGSKRTHHQQQQDQEQEDFKATSETRESTLEAPKRKNTYRHTVVLPFELDGGFATEPRVSHKKTPQQEPHTQLLDQYFYGSKTDSDYCSQHSKEFSSQFSSFLT